MTRLTVGISFDESTISKIDAIRGMVPRSRFIEKIILETIEKIGDKPV